MASELVLSGLTVAFTKANVPSVSVSPASISITVTGNQIMDNVQAVGTSEEAILLGDVAAGGVWFVQNMDATNFVELRSGAGATDFIKLLAGEWALFRTSADASAPFAIADTASVNVRFLRFDL
jgi:hypothetical protein